MDRPLLLAILIEREQSAVSQIEQGGGQAFLWHLLGADVFALHRAEARRRGVLQRETRRRFDRGSPPQKRPESGRGGQSDQPQDDRNRPAQHRIPLPRPRHLGPWWGRDTNACPHRDRGAGWQIAGRQRDRVTGNPQPVASPADTGTDRALCTRYRSGQRHRYLGRRDLVVPARRDHVPEERRRRRRVAGR